MGAHLKNGELSLKVYFFHMSTLENPYKMFQFRKASLHTLSNNIMEGRGTYTSEYNLLEGFF
jgi:hypothetical protein